jgi:hypothetical protein
MKPIDITKARVLTVCLALFVAANGTGIGVGDVSGPMTAHGNNNVCTRAGGSHGVAA